MDRIEDASALSRSFAKSISRDSERVGAGRYDKVSKSRAAFLQQKQQKQRTGKGKASRDGREAARTAATQPASPGGARGEDGSEGGGAASSEPTLSVYIRGEAISSRETIADLAALPHISIVGTLGATREQAEFARDVLVAEGVLNAGSGEWRVVGEHLTQLGGGEEGATVDAPAEGDGGQEGGASQAAVGIAEDGARGGGSDDGGESQQFSDLRWLYVDAS